MTMRIEPSRASLGATITNVSLGRLPPKDWRAIENAFHQYALLIFPGQHLSDSEQLDFAGHFGEFEEMERGKPTLALSNRTELGKKWGGRDDRTLFQRGNERWHTDSSYMPVTAKASVVSARIVPDFGAGTEWADARAAYDELDPATRDQVCTLAAYHSYFHSQGQLGHHVKVGSNYGFDGNDLPLHPLVKVHPVTTKCALYLGRHAFRIPGMRDDDAQVFLRRLLDFTCQPPRLYKHRWEVGDVVVWDNRCLLHRAEPYDDKQARLLMHTRISGDRQSETALNYR